MMKARFVLAPLAVLGIAVASPAFGDDDDGNRRWWHGESKGEYTEGPCKVTVESDGNEHVKEIKCKDGVGASWQGEWKKEYEDGDCKVKIETKRDEYKEEVKCD